MRGTKKAEPLNFRKGEFAARGQLEVFRTKIIVAALLFFFVLSCGALTMHLGYLQKIRTEKSLRQQMTQVFRQIMPANAKIVDVPIQLQTQLNGLQQQVQLFGLGGQGAAAVLQSMSSSIERNTRVDLDEFNYSNKEVRVSGNADSFDAVNQIAEKLGADRLFAGVEIVDAKLAADNNLVNFELQLKLHGGEE
jgi:type II secretory pathway component PulL